MQNEKRLEIKHHGQLEAFLADCKIEKLENKRLLEIGFKNGLFLNECYKAGLQATGIEVNRQYYEDTKSRLPYLDLVLYDGGTIPVPDESFDFIVSFQVLEHVKSPEFIFSECKRILKPEGIMYHVYPNYGSFYEGHFKVIWFPFLNKTLGRWYLKLLRKYNPDYEGLNLINAKRTRKALEQQKDNFNVLSLGTAEFMAKFHQQQINKVDQKFLRKTLGVLNSLTMIKSAVLKFLCWANWYYPITIIATRKV